MQLSNIEVVFQFVWSLHAAANMARGQQKLQSQAKAQEKQAKMKKQSGHSANAQKKAAQKALVHVCAVCKVTTSIPEKAQRLGCLNQLITLSTTC